ncbi:MAG TPA: glycine cleavage system protein GcvH [Candidatus Merdenecus merdavium]|nr:glycine cleavage system protein GcvH [Candidatus Merdenecus merdavium]
MNNPEHLKYSKSHEWVEFLDETTARVGITDFAQNSLGGLVFVNLPEEEDDITAGESLGDVESVKAVSDIISPISGKVAKINEDLLDEPEKINEDPYGAWFVEVSEISEIDELLDAKEYEAFCKEEE